VLAQRRQDRPAQGIFRPQQQQVHAHQDRRQYVVEVVGDAAGEGADALQPLGTQGLFVKPLLLRDVGVEDQHRPGPAGLVADQCPAAGDQDVPAVARHLAQFAAPLVLLQHRPQGLVQLGRRPAAEQLGSRPPERLGGRPAVEALGPAVPEDDPPVHVLDEDDVAGLVEQGGLFAQPFLGPAPVGHVAGDDGVELAPGRPRPPHRRLQRELLAVGAHALLQRGGQPAEGGVGPRRRPLRLAPVAGEEAPDRLPQGRRRRAAEQPLGRGVEQGDAAVLVADEDGVTCRADDAGQPGLRLRQPLLGPHLGKDALDRLGDVIDILDRLAHKSADAGPQCLDDGGLVAEGGDQDDGEVVAGGLEAGVEVEPGLAAGHALAEQDQGDGLAGRQRQGLGRGRRRHDPEAGLLQPQPLQLGDAARVLDDQDGSFVAAVHRCLRRTSPESPLQWSHGAGAAAIGIRPTAAPVL
jgi:hypothetical protein